ncbi:MAG: glycosyltransferase family 4 protein [Candidatus Calescibacterium sp.]|nr:glycosyltransferase family 4 protein [Candidatus Calescibacterium sp.]MDW8132358.1 glycosyltransferase family 4 protein [Candidatus Calescibacterium sp.]
MEIWIFNHYATTPNYPGGTRHFDFAKQLIKKGHKVTIFSSSFHYLLLQETKKYEDTFYKIDDYNGVRFVWIKTNSYVKSDWKRVINMLVYSYRAYLVGKILGKQKKPDIIIGSSVHLFAPFIAYLLSKYFRVPFILELRDLWPQALIDLGVSKYHPFIIVLSILEKFLYQKANKIISLLPNVSEYLKKYKVEEKVVWIPNGIDLERIKINESQNNNNVNNDTIKVAYAGSMGKVNDISIIVDLAHEINKRFNNVKLVILGGGYEASSIKEKIKNLNNVIFFDKPVSKDMIYGVLKDFDILFFHISDIFPYGISCNKLFDYLAVGKPIIFSANVPNNLIEDAKAGITVKDRSVNKIIDALEKILSLSEEERRKMGENGKIYVEKNYSVQLLAEKLEAVIQEVYSDFMKK